MYVYQVFKKEHYNCLDNLHLIMMEIILLSVYNQNYVLNKFPIPLLIFDIFSMII